MNTLAKDAVIMPQGLTPKIGSAEISEFWFPKDGSKTIIKHFDYVIEDLKVDENTAFVRSSSTLGFEYESNGQKIIKNDQKYVHSTFLERQKNGQWKVSAKVWSSLN